MDKSQRKQMIEEWKSRTPDMGIIALKCKETGESFLGASKDINADLNSIKVKLSSGYHPNKRLLTLWKQYGEEGFEFSVLEKVEFKDDKTDYKKELEELRELLISENPEYSKIWK